MANKLFKDLREVEYDIDTSNNPRDRHASENYTIEYQGDPIFVVDPISLTIKNCIVKHIKRSYDKYMMIYCCEKGKYRNWTPRGEKSPSDWLIIDVNKNSSTSSIASTTLKGAMKILELFKSKGSFSSLAVGDSVYALNSRKNELIEHKITKIENKDIFGYNRCNKFTIIFDNGSSVQLSTSYYESKASIYSDNYYSYRQNGKWADGEYMLFVKKEDAQSYLDKKIKMVEKSKKLQSIGTDTNINDAKGNRLHVGDTVVYINGSGTYINLSTAKVIGFTPKMIKVLDEERRDRLIESSKESLKRYVERGGKPYEIDFTNYGVYCMTTPKLMILEKYNKTSK